MTKLLNDLEAGVVAIVAVSIGIAIGAHLAKSGFKLARKASTILKNDDRTT